ncbi:MAG: transcriptional repressor [Aureispira sp.]|nr:transcriptional repressor [Aureispira sp.]
MQEKIERLLAKYKLRNTNVRREVLSIFTKSSYALTHRFIEKEMQEDVDRVTLYRTLKTFEDKGVIHRIADESDTIRYALCKDDCQEHQHQHSDNHVHFKCESCKQTVCLENVEIPNVKLPEGFIANKHQFLVIGICSNCK